MNQNQPSCEFMDISLNDLKAGSGGELAQPMASQVLSQALASKNTTLQTLIMDKCALGPDGAAHLAEALRTNTTLKVLHLAGNMIGPIGAMKLFDALKMNSTLEELGLKMNRIGGGAEKEDVQSLSHALGRSGDGLCRITKLDLSYNDLRCSGCAILSLALGQPQCSIEELILEKNDIGDKGTVALAHSLAQVNGSGSKIRTLVLRGNAIGDVGAKALGEMLTQNDSLEILDASSCSIGNEGGAAIGMSLSANSTLQTLLLDKNSLGSGRNYAIFTIGLSTNKSLTFLHLSGNRFSDTSSTIRFFIMGGGHFYCFIEEYYSSTLGPFEQCISGRVHCGRHCISSSYYNGQLIRQ